MNRLGQLEPEAVDGAQCDTQAYALEYIERHQRDVPRLERKRDLLLAALGQAWQREQYGQVVQLIAGLSYLAGRFDDCGKGEQLLRRGIEACQRVRDMRNLAYFLNRLGGLLWSHCDWANARQVWEESLEIAQESGHPACLWEPLSSLAHVADILGEYEVAQRFAETFLRAQRVDDTSSIAVVLFIRGFYARLGGKRDKAYEDYVSCLHLLSFQDPDTSYYEHFFVLEVQAELARLHDDYAHAQAYTEASLSLARAVCDPYTVAVLLWDQALFALQQGMLDDVRQAALQLLDAKFQVGAPHFYQCGKWLLKQLPVVPRGSPRRTFSMSPSLSVLSEQPIEASSQGVSHPLPESISEREMEVLQLIAAGCSNREIAARLVIAVGTVKKHVENIYNKLDVHRRTQLVARARALGLLMRNECI